MSKLIIFTAPSGAGKTTIVRHLLTKFPDLSFSVSATTRQRRTHEQDGVDYYFISMDDFRRKVADGAFVEWEEVYEGLLYGTLRAEVERLWNAGKHIIFDIDVKGAVNLKKAFPDNSLAVFVKPPDPETLFERLRNRQTESEDSIRTRIARAADELTYEDRFDAVLVNDQLDVALAEAESLVRAYLYPEEANEHEFSNNQ